MGDFVDIFSQLDLKIAETLASEPTVTDLVQTIEAKSSCIREYGNGEFQPLIEAFKLNELPVILTATKTEGATGDNRTTGMDQYFIPCASMLIISGKTKQDVQSKAQKITYYTENVLRNQKSGVRDFNGHGGMLWDNPITTFEYTVFNNKYYCIATTEFTVYTVQEFDII